MPEIVPSDPFSKLPERYQARARQIAARVADIDAMLKPAVPTEVGEEVKRLRRQLRPQPDTDPAEMAIGFRDACRDLPIWAISEAANDFLNGRVENHTGQFMPTCAEFAKRARSILTPIWSERHALRVEAEKMIERAADDARRHAIAMERADPKVKERVGSLMATLPKTTGKLSWTHSGLPAEQQKTIDSFKRPPRPSAPSRLAETGLVRRGEHEERRKAAELSRKQSRRA